MYHKFILVQGGKSYSTSKLAIMKKKWKNPTTYILMLILYSDLLLFQSPGFESRPAQTLIVCNFEALWPVGSKTNFFERSDLYLLGKGKKIGFAALWRHFMLSQNTLKSYHKTQIDRERLKPAVCNSHFENSYALELSFWVPIASSSTPSNTL